MIPSKPNDVVRSTSALLTSWGSRRIEARETDETGETSPATPATPRHAAPRPRPETARGPVGRRSDSVAASREIFEVLGMTGLPAGAHAAMPAALPVAPRTAPPGAAAGPEKTDRKTVGTTIGKTVGTIGDTIGGWKRARHAAEPAVMTEPVATPRRASPPAAGTTTDVVFPERLGSRRIVGLLTLILLVATGGAAYLAYNDPRPFTLGVAGTLLIVTLVLYAVRAGSSPARLAIRSGQLEVVQGARREIFDLTSRYARVEVVGTPGRPGWKVLFGRFGRDPFVVNATMVDPTAFTEALQRHRPRE